MKVECSTIQNKFLRVKTLNYGASLFEVYHKKKKINLILNWQRVGFIHGVINTDNMSLSGETLDYGPCAYLDEYNPNKVFSSIDHKGRYSFSNQPRIAMWNLARLAETFLHLVDKDEKKAITKIEKILLKYEKKYQDLWLIMMKNKIGINQNHEKDKELIKELLDLMHVFKLDYTNTFVDIQKNTLIKNIHMKDWVLKLKDRKKLNINLKEKININPVIIPRNHIIESLLNDVDEGNFDKIEKFIDYFPFFFDEMNKSNFIKTYRKYYWWNDVHFNKLGNKIIAEKLLEIF